MNVAPSQMSRLESVEGLQEIRKNLQGLEDQSLDFSNIQESLQLKYQITQDAKHEQRKLSLNLHSIHKTQLILQYP